MGQYIDIPYAPVMNNNTDFYNATHVQQGITVNDTVNR